MGQSKKKAYKVINEEQVCLTQNGTSIYLPSRFRRGVAERVGRILRSQYKRHQCFNDCLELSNQLDLSGPLQLLVKQVARSLQLTQGRFYRYVLLRQTLRLLRRLRLGYLKQEGGFQLELGSIRYVDVVKPRLHGFMFPFGPDDDQLLKYQWRDSRI